MGRGTTKAPLIVAVERRREGPLGREPGACRLRVTDDCGGGSWRLFAREAVDPRAHVRADDWQGTRAGMGEAWEGLDQRPFDPSDEDASLPVAHHVISNFKACALGTFHGLPSTRLQSYADEFSWRYSHRGGTPPLGSLLDAAVALGPVSDRELKRAWFLPQRPAPLPRARERRRLGIGPLDVPSGPMPAEMLEGCPFV